MDMWSDQDQFGFQEELLPPRRTRSVGGAGWLAAMVVIGIAIIVWACLWHAPLAVLDADRVFSEVTLFEAYDEIDCAFGVNAGDQQEVHACGYLLSDAYGVIVRTEELQDAYALQPGERVSMHIDLSAGGTEMRPWAIIGNEIVLGEAVMLQSGATSHPVPVSTVTPKPVAPAAETPVSGPITIQQSMLNGQPMVYLQSTLTGLNSMAAYVAGFIMGEDGAMMDNAGMTTMIFGQDAADVAASVILPVDSYGKTYQVAAFFYSMTGDNIIIGTAQTFVVQQSTQLPEWTPIVTATPYVPTPSPSPVPTSTPTPTPVPQPVNVPTATPVSLYPTAKQFRLYPVETRYYYLQLTDNEKKLFALLYDSVSRFETETDTKSGYFTVAEYERVLSALRMDCPELLQFHAEEGAMYWTLGDRVVKVELPYYIPNKAQFDRVYQQVVDEIDSLQYRSDFGVTDYDHELCIYNYLIENTYYDKTHPNCAFADGPYVHGLAKCTGYAHAFTLACRYYGIPAGMLTGNTMENGSISPTGHQWGFVKIDNEWYMTDPTWDDPTYDGTLPPQEYRACLQYFNLTSSEMHMARILDDEFTTLWYIPHCTSKNASYYHRTLPDVTVRGDWQTVLRERMEEAYRTNDDIVILRFEDRSAYTSCSLTYKEVLSSWGRGKGLGMSWQTWQDNDSMLIAITDLEYR